MVDTRKVVSFAIEASIFLITFVAYDNVDTSVPHTKRGFFCGDPSLSLPHKKSTVRGKWLYVNFYGVPVAIGIIELFLQGEDFRKKAVTILKRVLVWFKYYYFTFMALTIVMASAKNLVGSYRPFFFDLCRPDVAVNCTTGEYISSDYKCTNPSASQYEIFNVNRSFPSGHVVVSAYSSIVLMWYLQHRIQKFPLLLTFTHLLSVMWMMLCGVTRITDHWHHVHDVIGGFLLTLPFAIYVCMVLCKNFRIPKKTTTSQE